MEFYLIGGFIGLMVLAVIWFRKILDQQVNAIASIMTVTGVLGTFAGIAWGLYSFDTTNIESSVPNLLEGLKFAFVTSILGILGSILLKLAMLNKQRKQSSAAEIYTGATVDDLAELLSDLLTVEKQEGNATNENLRSIESSLTGRFDDLGELLREILIVERQEGKETKEALQSIEKSLTGEGDSTVLTQLQKLRTSFSDKQDDLIRAFTEKQDSLIQAFSEFAQEMAENNTKALMEALENVIKDFNLKITEQFGDNFKQLNEAVGRINDWQEQYRQQMNELAAEFRVAAESIEISRHSLEVIAERSETIVSSAEQLGPILQALQQQIGQLETHLEAFSALAGNARDAFPIIEKRLDELTNGFTHVVQDTIDNSHASMQKQREALADQSRQLETTVEDTGNRIKQQTETVFERITARVDELTNGFTHVVQETIDNSHASMQKQREALADQSRQLETTVEDTGNRIKQQTETVFERITARVEQIINDTFQGFKSALENQAKQLEATIIDTNQGLAHTLQTQSTQLETAVENTSSNIKTMAEDFSTVVKATLDNSHSDMQKQREALEGFTRQVASVIQNASEKLEKSLDETKERLETTLQNQSRQLSTISTESERIFRESAERMNQQVRFLDEALQEELTKSLQSLGSQLTSLSNQFVQDYTPLTNRLKDVLDIARNLQGRTN